MKKKRMFAAGMFAIMIALTAGCGSAHGGQTNGKGTISSTQKTAGTRGKGWHEKRIAALCAIQLSGDRKFGHALGWKAGGEKQDLVE